MSRLERIAHTVHRCPGRLLVGFLVSLVALNWGRWSGWGLEGFGLHFSEPIMQTTLYDFAWVLGILTLFIHQDAKKHGLSYWYFFPTFPVMPTIGLLVYVIRRERHLSKNGPVPPLGA